MEPVEPADHIKPYKTNLQKPYNPFKNLHDTFTIPSETFKKLQEPSKTFTNLQEPSRSFKNFQEPVEVQEFAKV